jgi:cysteine synthase B
LDGINGAILESRRRRAENPDHYFMPDQYNNPANWRSHYTTTGPEIWRQTGGQVTHFVAGIGTSGTLMGVGRYLRRLNPVIKLYSVEPADELETIEGLKYMAGSIVPGIYDSTLPDEHLYVQAREAYAMALRLAREEGLFVGFSAGANVVAALRVAQTLEQGTVVTILPDGGEKYLSLIHEP